MCKKANFLIFDTEHWVHKVKVGKRLSVLVELVLFH